MQRLTLNAVKGGVQVSTGGQLSTTIVEGSFPGCTVTVFNTGTNNLTSIFSDNLNPPTVKANPFLADASAFAFFYAANGARVDIQLSGTGITVPFLVASDVLFDDPAGLFIGLPQVVAFSATPAFNFNVSNWFQLTLTGNVTAPTFPNPSPGQLLFLSLILDAAGGHTFAFPGSFLHPPTISTAVNAHTELIFKFDGSVWTQVASSGDNLAVPNNASIGGNATVGGTLIVTGAVTAGSYTNNLGAFAATTSAKLLSVMSDETGTGSLVFNTSPTLVTPVLGAATGTSLALGGGTALTTTNQTGTGSLVLATSPAITTPTIDTINQKAATAFLIKDNTGGTRFSIPSGGVTASTLNNTNVTGGSTLTSPTVINGITQGSGFKHQRFGATCATSAAGAGSTCTTAYTWTSAFADASYTVMCNGIQQSNTPTNPSLESVIAAGFTARVMAVTAAAGSFAGLDCIAVHD